MTAFDPVYLTLSDDPQTIVRKMDEFKAARLKTEQTNQRRKRIPKLLALAGLGLVVFDVLVFRVLLRYSVCLFTPVAVVCWISAIVMSITLRRSRMRNLAPGYGHAREIVHTLRDDIKSGSSFLGTVDLTGLEQKSKIARETKDLAGRTNRLYRDQWLSLKLKMYDGNILRVSVTERSKTRLGFWKRSMSGKMKWKPEKFKGRVSEMKLRVAVNPEVYEINISPALQTGAMVGEYAIAQADGNGGILTVSASTSAETTAVDILNVMRVAYDSLKRKVTA